MARKAGRVKGKAKARKVLPSIGRVKYKWRGRALTLGQVVRLEHASYFRVYTRLRKGWSLLRALRQEPIQETWASREILLMGKKIRLDDAVELFETTLKTYGIRRRNGYSVEDALMLPRGKSRW